jgi:hypothetical protein
MTDIFEDRRTCPGRADCIGGASVHCVSRWIVVLDSSTGCDLTSDPRSFARGTAFYKSCWQHVQLLGAGGAQAVRVRSRLATEATRRVIGNAIAVARGFWYPQLLYGYLVRIHYHGRKITLSVCSPHVRQILDLNLLDTEHVWDDQATS